MEREFDFAIIGAGPGGMTAALYASRAGLQTVMIDASAPGGKLLKTHRIDNYPGVPTVSGFELAMTMNKQATSFGAEMMFGKVVSVNKDKQLFLEDGTIINAKAVLIATGANERLLNIPGEQEAIGHGESFCAVCDGAFFRNKEVIVIGGGNAALEESQFLTQFASHVTIVIRRDEFRATEQIQREIEENDKISVIRHHTPERILMEDGKVSGIVLKDVETGMDITIPCQGVFPYIGQDPATEFAKDLGILNEKGYVVVDDKMQTSAEGIFACGDCIAKDLRQVVTACGDGAIAGEQAFHYVRSL